MSRKMIDQGPDLFAWGASRPAIVEAEKPRRRQAAVVVAEPVQEPVADAPAIDFLSRRDKLPRRILNPPPPFLYLDRQIARKHGLEPPAPIIAFGRRARPPDAGADGGAPLGRTG